MSDALRALPAVHRLLDDPSIAPYEHLVGRNALRAAVAAELDRVRSEATIPPFELLRVRVAERLDRTVAQTLLPVLNATGVLLHTNLGRAPLAAEAYRAAFEIGSGYSNLEYDVVAGERGSRYERINALLGEVTGAQDALIVNNCAAAVLLILDSLARGREVVVARNQLIEIGGGFRLPDVLARSGATLVEAGTTNRVYLRDYEAALSPRTALLLRSHPSNYSIKGFTHDPSGAEVAALGKRVGIPVAEDLGSGALVDISEYGLARERTVQDALADGTSLVAFSGDKLLGGPQAGIIVGSSAAIARLRSNPLLRALRVDKTTLAMLAATLQLYRTAETRARIPFYRMLGTPLEALRVRGAAYVNAIEGAHVVDSLAFAGGGSLPGSSVASVAIAFETPYADALAARLRANRPAVIARIAENTLLLDLRTLAPEHDHLVIAALNAISSPS